MSNIGECSLITDETTDLRQGDIFYYTDKDENENYGIIITGDCDIDKNKCNNTISYCSIFTAKYHIQTKVLREKINKQLSPLKDSIFDAIWNDSIELANEGFLFFIKNPSTFPNKK